jgi:hypothetical protein
MPTSQRNKITPDRSHIAIGVEVERPPIAGRPFASETPAFCAAVPGAAFHRSSARPAATGASPTAATPQSASGLPERLNLLPHDLFTS